MAGRFDAGLLRSLALGGGTRTSPSPPGQEDASAGGRQLRRTSETGRGGALKAPEDLWRQLLCAPLSSLRGAAAHQRWGSWAGGGVA